MSDRVYVGRKCASMSAPPAFDPISKIVVMVDSDNAYEAGDDSGFALEISCPYGSQALADKLLAKYSGFVYQPMSAEDALVDPAAELGDWVSVGPVNTILAEQELSFDALLASNIKAPGEKEVDSEYPFQTKEQRLERKLAITRSLLTKTAEEIRLEVQGVDGKISALAVTLEGVTITDEDGTTLIKGSSIDTSTIKAKSITAAQLELTGAITFDDLTSTLGSRINAAYNVAHNALDEAEEVGEVVAGWVYTGTTMIDGTQIVTGTVTASKLRGGEISLLTSGGNTAGAITLTGASSSSYAVEFASNGALRLVASAAFWVESGYGQFGSGANGFSFEGNLVPYSNSKYSLGRSGLLWSELYASTGTINTSDRNAKNSIDYDISKYEELYDGLKPCSFKLNDGTSGRTHLGMIAQDVESGLESAGLSSMDFAGFIKSPTDDGDIYGLRYSEFIALNIWQIQMLKARVAELERKLE